MTSIFGLIGIGAIGPGQIAVVVILVLLLFGKGKISGLMGDLGKGITSFKKGLKDEVDDVKDAAEEAINVTPKKEKDKS